MVRFVRAPDDRIVPDVAETLPGRGFWIRATRRDIDRAVAGHVFAHAQARAGGDGAGLVVADDLSDQVAALLRRRCLDLLGLGRRGGEIVAGFGAVSDMVAASKAGAVIIAHDSGADGRAKLVKAMRHDAIADVVTMFDSAELGAALGRHNVVYVGYRAGALCRRFIADVVRLKGCCGDGTTDQPRAAA